ncbi:hypothetical protein PtA15_15A59 [Puccinia triticina]|uniref:Uncharacterized protein n=2 Tax=Puccinia triticina TaxID=208348 RepID=A0ABY7D242_9BASI|nr:uncharacterized protein PtA15_15A59 [Puccinia triticina]WAQ91669.1 hypothetical protein PtA15_15A59 [Puccinia triticina]
MSRPYGTPVGQDQGYSSPGNYNGHPQSGQRGTNYSTPTEIYPMGTSPGAWMNPQLSAGRTPMAHPIHGALPQASDCSHGHSASPRDLHSLQSAGRFPSSTPDSHAMYSGQIGPRGPHPNLLFLESPSEHPTSCVQQLSQDHHPPSLQYTCTSPLAGPINWGANPAARHNPPQNPNFLPSGPMLSPSLPPPVNFSPTSQPSKPAPKKRAPRKKAATPSRPNGDAPSDPSPPTPAVPPPPQPPAPSEETSPNAQRAPTTPSIFQLPQPETPPAPRRVSFLDDPDSSDAAPPAPRKRAPPEVMEQIQNDSLDKLRARAARYAEYLCLTADDKLALEEAYRQYQSPIYHDKSIPFQDRMVSCGELWRLLDFDTQDQWRDQDFLDTITPPDSVASASEDSPDAVAQWKKRERFKLKMWIRKVKRDLKNLSVSHQVEGFFAIASRDPHNPELITGGSFIGEEFLDVLEGGTNTCQLFYNFVNGQQAVKAITGAYPKPSNKRKRRSGKDPEDGDCPHDLGSKLANAAEVRAKLKEALCEATGGVWTKGWPGTKTEQKLRDLDVTLQVLPNSKGVVPADFCARPSDMRIARTRRILTAFANGWVRLIGPPAEASDDRIRSLGHKPDSEDPDEAPRITVRLNSTQITSEHHSRNGVKRVGPKRPVRSKAGKASCSKRPRKTKSRIFESEDDTSSLESDDGVAPKRRMLTRHDHALINSTGIFREERSVTPTTP